MTEWEKAQNGYLYNANYDKEIVEARTRCADLCYDFNHCKPSDTERQKEFLEQIIGVGNCETSSQSWLKMR